MDKEILEQLKTYDAVIGIDEVGRGPVAGPVTVAAFLIKLNHYDSVRNQLLDITDSKKLTEKKREYFAGIIKDLKKQGFLDVVITSVSARDIDERGIVAALRAATKTSLTKITREIQHPFVYLDGSLVAPLEYEQETIIKGDAKNWLISAASVVAKVARDHLMVEYGKQFPGYGFENHKGYGTKAHYEAIKKRGVLDIHRKTWISL
jgi:ribonuclease HII